MERWRHGRPSYTAESETFLYLRQIWLAVMGGITVEMGLVLTALASVHPNTCATFKEATSSGSISRVSTRIVQRSWTYSFVGTK